MELLESVRIKMTEQKFSDVQRILEEKLLDKKVSSRPELIEIYLDSLARQNKQLPPQLVCEHMEFLAEKNPERALYELERLPKDHSDYRRIQKIKIRLFENLGLIENLNGSILDYYQYLIAAKVPALSPEVDSICDRYFRRDFKLSLHRLTLTLMRGDSLGATTKIEEILFACLERATLKGNKLRFEALEDVLAAFSSIPEIVLYKALVGLLNKGIRSNVDRKRLLESVIYFDSFRIQTILLQLLDQDGLHDIAENFAVGIRAHSDYDFVYFDRFFPHLKKYFVSPKSKQEANEPTHPLVDLHLEEPNFRSEEVVLDPETQTHSRFGLYFQDLSVEQLLDLTVGFLQSDFLSQGLEAMNACLQRDLKSDEFLKASYLKLTILLKLKDYRGALDVSLMALGKAQNESDILSFMYSQADALVQLGEIREAKKVLKKIMNVNSNYRLCREKLARLDEI